MSEDRTRTPIWVWIALAILMAGGAWVRFHRLDNQSLWLDEYTPPYISAGLGQPGISVFTAPTGVVLEPPPPVNLRAALPWWRIWTGIDSELHPPLYYIVLRFWMDLFGESDFVLRALSSLFGLVAPLLLFAIVKRQYSPQAGLLAAGLLLFPLAQIDLSRETRSYTMLLCLGLICCGIVLWIERRGANRWRVLLLGLAALAMQMTHYFAVGYLAGLGLYALLRFRERKRITVLAALITAEILMALLWTPALLRQRHIVADAHYPPPATTSQILQQATFLPTRLISWPNPQFWYCKDALLILVCLVPLLSLRRMPSVLLWWLWMVCGIGIVIAGDIARQTFMIYFHKYVLCGAPAMCALMAIPLIPGGKLTRVFAPLYIALCFAAVWKTFQTIALTDELMDPQNSTAILSYLGLLSLGVIAARIKNSWAIWVGAAVVFFMPLHVALEYPNAYPTGFAVWGPVGAYLLLLVTAPVRPVAQWMSPLAGWAVVVWSILCAVAWMNDGSTVIPKMDWRNMARLIDKQAMPGDLVAFTSLGERNPCSCYIVYRHYAPDSDRPAMFLKDVVPSSQTLHKLSQRPRVWVVGSSVDDDTGHYFPGWNHGEASIVADGCQMWQVFPPSSAGR